MLRSTFLHLKGVGGKTERLLWQKGLTTWEAYAAAKSEQKALFGAASFDAGLSESMAAYARGDMEFFARTLPPAEYYRAALEFPRDTLFLDIETTGLSVYYDSVTIVGWSMGGRYGVYINGRDDRPLREALAAAKVLVTFNGVLFDLKFLRVHFKDLATPPLHLDLRFFAKRVGLSGGQKAVEKAIGLARKTEIADMRGEAAPALWRKYKWGDLEAMRRLIEYNHADVEGMKWILDACAERYAERKAIPENVRKAPGFRNLTSRAAWAGSEEDYLIIPAFWREG